MFEKIFITILHLELMYLQLIVTNRDHQVIAHMPSTICESSPCLEEKIQTILFLDAMYHITSYHT